MIVEGSASSNGMDAELAGKIEDRFEIQFDPTNVRDGMFLASIAISLKRIADNSDAVVGALTDIDAAIRSL